jgi:isoleucyl-tRNA synthetase
MKLVAEKITTFSQQQILALEKTGLISIEIPNKTIEISIDDVEILGEDIPGWLVANAGTVTIALDISLTEQLIEEGHAREFVSLMQRMRKDKGLDITDKIKVSYSGGDGIATSLINFKMYICAEILADTLEPESDLPEFEEIIVNEILLKVFIQKI